MKLRELSIGAVVRDARSPLPFLVAAQNHPGYRGTTLYAQKIVELGCLDGAEPERGKEGPWKQAYRYGNNDYACSNVHQWLNSAADVWYAPTHQYDTPPRSGVHPLWGGPLCRSARLSDAVLQHLPLGTAAGGRAISQTHGAGHR